VGVAGFLIQSLKRVFRLVPNGEKRWEMAGFCIGEVTQQRGSAWVLGVLDEFIGLPSNILFKRVVYG
jgi:hypothetical protein